jgi:hypothetical protein
VPTELEGSNDSKTESDVEFVASARPKGKGKEAEMYYRAQVSKVAKSDEEGEEIEEYVEVPAKRKGATQG